MKTIVLGYGDINGKGPGILLAGPEVPQRDQVDLVTGIKASGNYPDGVVRVEFAEVVNRNVGVCLKAASKFNAANKEGEQQRLQALWDADPVRKAKADREQLRNDLSAAATARNAVLSRLAPAENALRSIKQKLTMKSTADLLAQEAAAEDAVTKIKDDIAEAESIVANLSKQYNATAAAPLPVAPRKNKKSK